MLRSIAFAAFASFELLGCYAHGTVEPVGAVTVTSAPPDNIATYPSTSYEGRPVYLYRDRWYYREGDRWNYYRDEPRELREHRQRVIVAPPKREHDEREDRDRRDRPDRR